MGGYVQNYYEEMFMKRPLKLKTSMDLEVSKMKQNRQK